MIIKLFRVITCLLLIVGLVVGGMNLHNYFHNNHYITQSAIKNRPDAPRETFIPHFTKQRSGLENVAFISMVKDEDDIIYQNLVWHFAVGFRKFIIFDHNSTDKTASLIKQFADETRGIANVFVSNNPIKAFNQSSIITSGYRMAHEIWPEVEWFFPIDADEFWVFSQDPAKALAMIPANVDVVSGVKLKYHPADDYKSISTDEFWRKMHYRDAVWGGFDEDAGRHSVTQKIFLRYSDNFSIASGNHHVIYNDFFSIKGGEEDGISYHNIIENVVYEAADLYGIHLREYQLRSPKQVHKKIINSVKAIENTPKTDKQEMKIGSHWHNYQSMLSEAESIEEAAEKRFEMHRRSRDKDDVVDDPLPIDLAISVYKQLCGRK